MADNFLCFSLALFQFEAEERQILDLVLNATIMRAGLDYCTDRSKGDVLKYIDGSGKARRDDFDHRDEQQRACMAGIVTLQIIGGFIPKMVAGHNQAAEFVTGFESRNGRHPLVFVASDIFWSCYNRPTELSFVDFTIICAINSVCGIAGRPSIIRREMIEARRRGFKSQSAMQAAIHAGDSVHGSSLSTSQLRTRLDRLEERGYFIRCIGGRRTTYFSTRQTREDLRKFVVEKVKQRRRLAVDRTADRAALAIATR